MRSPRWPAFAAFAASLAPGFASAQAVEPVGSTPQQWGAITMFHGLPSPNVRAIVQDLDGILWFGTDAGLVRHDGQRLERIALPRPATAVRALAVDARGSLWLGTDGGGFVRRANRLSAIPDTRDSSITAISPQNALHVWLASATGAVFDCALRGDGSLAVVPLGPERTELLRGRRGATLEISALASGPERVWLGSLGRGLLSLHGGEVTQLTQRDRPFFVTSVVRDEAGRIFLGSGASRDGRGVYELVGEEIRRLDVVTGPVSALAPDRDATLWVGTRGQGLFEVRNGRIAARHTFATSAGGLLSDQVLALFVDRDGVLWIGTDRGVCRFDPHGPRQEKLGSSPDSNFVHALLPTPEGALWAGTQKGLFVRDVNGWRQVPAFGDRPIRALATAADGRMLVGTARGLYAASAPGDGRSASWRLVGSTAADAGQPDARSVRGIQSLSGETYVGSFGRGLERLEGDALVPVWPPPDSDATQRDVISLSAAEESLWIGTAAAGTYLYSDGRTERHDALSEHGALWSVAASQGGGLWAATARGLVHVGDEGVTPLFAGDEVRALLPGPGPTPSVWCGTARSGVVRLSLDPRLGPISSRLGSDYGLPSDSVFAMAEIPAAQGGGAGQLAFGTNRGLAFYEPARAAPGIRLLRVLGHRAYSPEEWNGLVLEYPQNSLLVQAAATGGRTYPEHFQYLFILTTREGREVRRTLSAEGQFGTESLDAGTYRIEARALGIDLAPSAPTTLTFEVGRAPIPWPSIALGALLAASLLALGWGYAQYRQLQRANRALGETRLQLVQETESERRRIARDLHDQTLADLRGLLLMEPTSDGSASASPGYRQAVEAISTEVRRICEDLSPSVLENVGLTAALEWAFGEAARHMPEGPAGGARFTCGDDVEERLTLDSAARIQIYRIVQEALTNATRHARPRELILRIELLPSARLEISVEDDGAGFDPSRTTAGRGLANMRSRASLIGAEISWAARSGGGTRFSLAVPNAGRVRPERSRPPA